MKAPRKFQPPPDAPERTFVPSHLLTLSPAAFASELKLNTEQEKIFDSLMKSYQSIIDTPTEPVSVYRLSTVAKKLQVSVMHVYNLIQAKKLPQPISIGGTGRAVGILVTEFDAAVKEWASNRDNTKRAVSPLTKKKIKKKLQTENHPGGGS